MFGREFMGSLFLPRLDHLKKFVDDYHFFSIIASTGDLKNNSLGLRPHFQRSI